MAIGIGTKLIINTDSHAVDQMDNMEFGVSVARRGWATKADVINTWDWDKFSHWLGVK
jgi:DNA polymerase (family 10)